MGKVGVDLKVIREISVQTLEYPLSLPDIKFDTLPRVLEPHFNADGSGMEWWMTRVPPIAMLVAFATFSAALAAEELAPTASNPVACATPQISAQVRYHEKKVEYDLGISFTITNKSRERVWGKYKTERKVGFKTDFEGECLRRLDVLVEVFPTIHLVSDYHYCPFNYRTNPIG